MRYVDEKQALHPAVDFIVLNDTRRPKTGGDYVYAVMKDELTRQAYCVSEMSVPRLVESVVPNNSKGLIRQVSILTAEVLANLRCYLASLRDFGQRSRLIITSSCPAFPVFGDLTYHQPKAGICTELTKQNDGNVKRLIGYRVQENERLSPMWLIAKELIALHLSNSKFTKELVERIFGLESRVLYPPVPVMKYLKIDLHAKRKPYVYITRPQAITGISMLPEIARKLPKNTRLIITGNLDQTGSKVLRALRNIGIDFEYLGFVAEQVKMEILSKSSVYINLAVNETFGITVVEALAAGCLPVAHSSGSIPEYLPSDFRYSDADECAEQVTRYINSGSEPREELRPISLRFDEAKFRSNFMVSVRQLESSLRGQAAPL